MVFHYSLMHLIYLLHDLNQQNEQFPNCLEPLAKIECSLLYNVYEFLLINGQALLLNNLLFVVCLEPKHRLLPDAINLALLNHKNLYMPNL